MSVEQMQDDHHFWMEKALYFAQQAANIHEVPVGALVVKDGAMIGFGFNRREVDRLAIKHAELDALTMASKTLGSWRLIDCTLYVTLEPCIMCAGALVQSRIRRVFYGARDPKAGGMGSLYSIHQDTRLNHRIEINEGVMGDQASELLRNFFRERRKKSSSGNSP
jgi:tRNA(adenine34) deaminase